MSKWTRREFAKLAPAVLTAAVLQRSPAQPAAQQTVLWFNKPAGKWTDALPIGNGRLGAMVFGGVPAERLQLNEDSLWSGAPRQWNNPTAKQHLPEVRRLVLEQADYVGADRVCRQMQGIYNESYLVLGNLHIRVDHPADVVEYRRELDLDTALARVAYRIGSATYLREAFASAPDQVIVVRLNTTAPSGMGLALYRLRQSRALRRCRRQRHALRSGAPGRRGRRPGAGGRRLLAHRRRPRSHIVHCRGDRLPRL
ncbi:MAG: glycoside hydrolase family 95 protein [Bryobacteraceae bacterium]